MKAQENNPEGIKDYLNADMDDIIFEHRNKAYGGYLLRKIYPGNMTKANIVATVLFLLLVSLPLIAKIIKANLPQGDETLAVEVTLAEPPPLDPKAPPPPPPPIAEPPPRKPTIAFVAPKVKKDEEVVEEAPPPDVEEIKDVEISTKTQEGVETGVPEGIIEEEAPPPVVEIEVAEKPDSVFKVVEQKPQFPDGDAALLKYLYDNIQYPSIARENGV
ncbi:MAG: energy transducer TonB, partial [Bacteroidota bacterium]